MDWRTRSSDAKLVVVVVVVCVVSCVWVGVRKMWRVGDEPGCLGVVVQL